LHLPLNPAARARSTLAGAQAIQLDQANVVVAGGMESMSKTPYYLDNARNGYRMNDGGVIDVRLLASASTALICRGRAALRLCTLSLAPPPQPEAFFCHQTHALICRLGVSLLLLSLPSFHFLLPSHLMFFLPN
jgi:hypothetical protein